MYTLHSNQDVGGSSTPGVSLVPFVAYPTLTPTLGNH